ncbi:MAG TPA: diacylglycerol kinase family protein [Polyangia bacterium]|jgi:diacylglycerol kinase family enzyme
MLLQAGARSRVAVILNQNARGVRPEIVERLGRLVPERDLFVSRHVSDSRKIARAVVAEAYDGVLFGGGDGTFVQCLSDLVGEADLRELPLPGVGVLRLGTGNALADALGASRPTLDGLVSDLRRARGARGEKMLPLLSVDGKLTPFAGCGLDAQILDDFARLGERIDELAGEHAQKIGPGLRYALTVAFRSTPRFVATRLPELEIVNDGEDAYRIDWRTGRVLEERPIARGEVLFRGRAALCSTSTIPYFGLRMKMFPYVEARRDRFQLRCSTASAYETLRNLPAVFRGEYRSPRLHDYLCQAITVRIERPVPFQVGGDLQAGLRDQVEISLAERPVRLLS